MNVDSSAYGACAPGWLLRAVLAVTRALPANWLGLRLSMPLRRAAIDWRGERPVDTTLWGMRVRLHPARNACEKMVLFTPQMFDVVEREVLAAAIERALAAGATFTFIDVGANVGIYSLYVAASGGAHARIVAIEPQPDITERLVFNVRANPLARIEPIPVAVSDREGEVDLVLNDVDQGGSYLDRRGEAGQDRRVRTVRVRSRPLAAVLRDAGITNIDALKVDIEGAEDAALESLLADFPPEGLPRLIIVEERPDWAIDLPALLQARGYQAVARSRINIIYRRDLPPTRR